MDSSRISRWYEERLAQRRRDGGFRELRDRDNLIDFCSNDYLGLAGNTNFQEVLRSAISEHAGTLSGATGSRLLTGQGKLVGELEARIRDHHRAESALFFPSGYAANSGLLSSMGRRGDVILYDELVHASMREGLRLSRAETFSFRHNSLESLQSWKEKLEARARSGSLPRDYQVFVAVESIYSMDGDAAPLAELVGLCEALGWLVVVDEAHGAGVLGDKGEGLVVAKGLENQVFARVVTYGKAFGCSGGAVLVPEFLRHYLINYCGQFIYTTAPSVLQLMAVTLAYEWIAGMEAERAQLKALGTALDRALELEPGKYPAAVRPCLVEGGNARAVGISEALAKHGFDCRPIRYPTVARGGERLRISLHSFNTVPQVEEFVSVLRQSASEL